MKPRMTKLETVAGLLEQHKGTEAKLLADQPGRPRPLPPADPLRLVHGGDRTAGGELFDGVGSSNAA